MIWNVWSNYCFKYSSKLNAKDTYFDDVRWLESIGVLLIDGLKWAGRLTIMENVALNRGSSKHGNILRAFDGWKRVTANNLKNKTMLLFFIQFGCMSTRFAYFLVLPSM